MWTNQPKIFLICFLPLLSNQFILTFLHICSPKHSQNCPQIYFLQHSLSYFLTFLAFRNAAMNSEKCTVCQKKLSDKRSLRRHMQAVHRQYVQTNFSRAMSAHLLMKKSWSSRHIWNNSTIQTAPDIVYTATSFLPITSNTWSI